MYTIWGLLPNPLVLRYYTQSTCLTLLTSEFRHPQVRDAPKWGEGAKGYLVRLPQDQEVLVAGERNLLLLSASGTKRAEAFMPQVNYIQNEHTPTHTHMRAQDHNRASGVYAWTIRSA